MANIVYNTLKLSAQIESALDQAANLFQERIDPYSRMQPNPTNIFDKDTNTHVCTWDFKSRWEPPLELYAELKAIKGVSVEATWIDEADLWDICYRWTGEGDKYEVVETGLTYPNGYVQTVELEEGCSRIEITVPDTFDQTILRRSELGKALWRLTFEPMDALEVGLTVFMDGHRDSGAHGRNIDEALHKAAEPYQKLFDGVDDDEARLTALLGLALALQEHVREYYPEDSEARKREELRRKGEELPF